MSCELDHGCSRVLVRQFEYRWSRGAKRVLRPRIQDMSLESSIASLLEVRKVCERGEDGKMV